MSGVGGIVHWNARPVSSRRLAAMIDLIRHRAPDGLSHEVREEAGLGSGRLALQKTELGHRQPVWSPDGLGLVADVRLYNAAALTSELRDVTWLPDQPSDAEVLLAGFERWGDAVIERVDGDYAFAVWDSHERRLFAARDPFGVRPFFYHWSDDKFVFGSEVKQVLCGAELPAEPDDMIVGEYLFENFEEARHTFFKDVRRLRAGHCLGASRSGVVEWRHWHPEPDREVWYDSPAAYAEPFRQLLRDSVRKRLQGDAPVLAHLSGGLDSSSLVFLAQEVCAEGAGSCAPVHTVSAVFPGLPCDETPEIEACLRHLRFPAHIVKPMEQSSTEGLEDEMLASDGPCSYVQRNVDLACREAIVASGARRLMMGVGGDELAEEARYLEELAARGHFVRWALEAASLRSATYVSTARLMIESGGPAAPRWVKRLGRPLVRPLLPKRWEVPWWTNPEFARFYSCCPEAVADPPPAFASALQRAVFRNLAHPRNARSLDLYEAMAARWGYELIFPFFDRPLSEFVLAIPFERREQRGRWKTLIRRSMADLLPAELLRRRRKVIFDSHVQLMLQRSIPELSRMVMGDGAWAAERFVPRECAARLLRHATEEHSHWLEDAWRVVTVELWLRGLRRYTLAGVSGG